MDSEWHACVSYYFFLRVLNPKKNMGTVSRSTGKEGKRDIYDGG